MPPCLLSSLLLVFAHLTWGGCCVGVGVGVCVGVGARVHVQMDEGESDTEEEKAAREVAKQKLTKYPGDVWKAARDNDVPMLRAFFLVKGTRRLLAAHNKAKTEGGRTLVHTAAWWGCDDVLRFLVALGANVNARDTMFCRTTPLMEAVRAGRRSVRVPCMRETAAPVLVLLVPTQR